MSLPTLQNIELAYNNLKDIVVKTPLQYNANLSKKYGCFIYLKREDLQLVRSYKLRGAYHMMSSLKKEEIDKGVVCASAGNHAQGFAYSCNKLKVKGVIFMPTITPKQKINQTKMFGEDWVDIKLSGDTFDDCAIAAKEFTLANNMKFIPPFDDIKIVEGQSTVAVEIHNELNNIDCVFVPIGGGGLISGVASYFFQKDYTTKIIGVEPEGAPSMQKALEANTPVTLNSIDSFVDGAAVKRVGDVTFDICKQVINKIQLVPEGKICTSILELYNKDAIVVEPAGALTIAALDYFAEEIKGKTIVCIIGGGNNDIDRLPEIKERSLQHEGLKHYFLIRFAQRPGALREFLNNVLGENDNITRFEYMQKTNKENGPALVGIELSNKNEYDSLIDRMNNHHINFSEINKNDNLFGYLI